MHQQPQQTDAIKAIIKERYPVTGASTEDVAATRPVPADLAARLRATRPHATGAGELYDEEWAYFPELCYVRRPRPSAPADDQGDLPAARSELHAV